MAQRFAGLRHPSNCARGRKNCTGESSARLILWLAQLILGRISCASRRRAPADGSPAPLLGGAAPARDFFYLAKLCALLPRAFVHSFLFMSELFIRQEILKNLPALDCILFDVDGVLLDVSLSFRAAIVDTVQFYIKEQLGLSDTGALIEAEETELFKFAGGFNDDWDLTNAAVAFLIGKWAQSGAKDTKALREFGPDWREFTASLRRKGGGLQQAEGFVLEMLRPTQRREFARAWNQKLVTRLFQEFYGGDEACRDLYGFDPEYLHGEGYYKRERVIIQPELVPTALKTGLITGRGRSEAKLGLAHARLTNKFPENGWVVPDSGFKKPDGRTLLLAREKLDFKLGLFIGDIMDDLRTVFNYRDLKGAGKARIYSAIVLSGPSGDKHKREFLEAGADIVAPDVNVLLEYLASAAKGAKGKG